MKKGLKIIFSILSIGLLTSCSFFKDLAKNGIGAPITDDYFTYTGNYVGPKDKSISGDLVIPSEVNGTPITKIDIAAFSGCSNITSIVIPDSIESIGDGAFSGCTRLNSITLPFVGNSRNATSDNGLFGRIFGVNEYAGGTKVKQYHRSTDFKYFCVPSSLRKVEITDADQLSYGAFSGCSMLTNININEDLVAVSPRCFYECSNLTSVRLSSVCDIPDYCFRNCSSLESFYINPNVGTIGETAFSGCLKLSSINSEEVGEFVVPKTVRTIGLGAFSGCARVTSITLPFIGKARDKNGEEGSTFGYIFGSSNYSGSIKITQSFKSGSRTYYIPSSLTKVTITDASQIGYGAFDDCSMITELNINIGARDAVGQSAFRNCIEPHYFSNVEVVENVTGQVVINEGNPKKTKSLDITEAHKQQFGGVDCNYVYISIFTDSFGELGPIFHNWAVANYSFLQENLEPLYTSKDIILEHNDTFRTDEFGIKFRVADFNALSTIKMDFVYDLPEGTSGNWSGRDYTIKNIKVVMVAD